jgi:23S rRNA (uracil1939-C5)-methyltransferase
MVVLVANSAELPSCRSFVNALIGRHPEITTVVLNVCNNTSKMMLGTENIVLFGDGFIEDTIFDRVFRISPRSFYQVNPVMTTVLYGKALDYMSLTGKETVVDAYCGTGTIGILAAKKAKKVVGIELNEDAVCDAKINAERNAVHNIDFYTANASDFMVEMAETKQKVDVVIMDPPRSGADNKFISAVAKLSPERVVYVSCNPESLERDLKTFMRFGYHAKKIQPVDMFPHTNHVESVVCLTKSLK